METMVLIRVKGTNWLALVLALTLLMTDFSASGSRVASGLPNRKNILKSEAFSFCADRRSNKY